MPVALGHDLHSHLHGCGPDGEPAGGVSGVGPDQNDLPASTVQVLQQRPGGVAVLDRGGGDHHGQHQAHGIHRDVPLASRPRSPTPASTSNDPGYTPGGAG